MRPLVIADKTRLETEYFLVAILFGDHGEQLDSITIPYTDVDRALELIRNLAGEYGVSNFDFHTSTKELYVSTLDKVGLNGSYKHRSETKITSAVVETERELLLELYEIELIEPKPRLPKWRSFLLRFISKLENYLKGDGKYEIH